MDKYEKRKNIEKKTFEQRKNININSTNTSSKTQQKQHITLKQYSKKEQEIMLSLIFAKCAIKYLVAFSLKR